MSRWITKTLIFGFPITESEYQTLPPQTQVFYDCGGNPYMDGEQEKYIGVYIAEDSSIDDFLNNITTIDKNDYLTQFSNEYPNIQINKQPQFCLLTDCF